MGVEVYEATHDTEYTTGVIGIDEVGRGPLAGPLTVCACRINGEVPLSIFPKGKLRDSKRLSPKARRAVLHAITPFLESGVVEFALLHTEAAKIDQNGMSQCLKEAVAEVLSTLKAGTDDFIRLDGALRAPESFTRVETIIKGDENELSIALASIFAKVARDELMARLAAEYPEYSWENNAGYGTQAHREAIKKYGLTEHHRQSFIHFA